MFQELLEKIQGLDETFDQAPAESGKVIKTTDEERTTFAIGNNSVIVTESTAELEFLEDIGEDALDKMGIDKSDFITKIEHIEVAKSKQGKGIGTRLMNEAVVEAKERGTEFTYLNASPIGTDGLPLNKLTSFYEKFGFKTFKGQGNNNLMIVKTNELKQAQPTKRSRQYK